MSCSGIRQVSRKLVLHLSTLQVQDHITVSAINEPHEQLLASGQQWSASVANVSAAPSHSTNSNNVAECSEKVVVFPEAAPTARTLSPSQTMEPTLLDERSLLACIVRAVPAGADGRIRISTTVSLKFTVTNRVVFSEEISFTEVD